MMAETATQKKKVLSNPTPSSTEVKVSVSPEIKAAVDHATEAKGYTGESLANYQNEVQAVTSSVEMSAGILNNTKNIVSGVSTVQNLAQKSIASGLPTLYADEGKSAEEIAEKMSGLKTMNDYVQAANEALQAMHEKTAQAQQDAPAPVIVNEPPAAVVDPAIQTVADEAVNYHEAARKQVVNPGDYFAEYDRTLYDMGASLNTIRDLKDNLNEENQPQYEEAIHQVREGFAAMYAKDGNSAAQITDKLSKMTTADDYLNAAEPVMDNILNSKERIDEMNPPPETRDYSFDGTTYTFHDGRQLSRDNYVLLCNVVAHEAGCEWLGVTEKGKCVAAIMNRCGGDTNNLPGVLSDSSQFSGNSVYVGKTEFNSNVDSLCEDAVMDYFSFPEKYDEKQNYFWYGDGVKNYFTRTYDEHLAVGSAVRRGDYFTAAEVEYNSECFQRTENRIQKGYDRAAMVDFVDYNDTSNEYQMEEG